MATDTLAPDALIGSTGFSSCANSDLTGVDGNWCVATDNNTDTETHNSFGTPSNMPLTGTDLQQLRCEVRRTSGSGTGDAEARIELWEDGSLVTAGTDTIVSSDTTQILTLDWDAASLGTADGSLVEIKVIGTRAGGGPAARSAVDVGFVEWIAEVAITGTGALVADDSAVSGSGQVEHTGTSALVTADSVVAASGIIGRSGTGALVAQDSVLAASGQVEHTGTSSLVAADSTVSGAGQVEHTGTSVLVVDDSVVAGTGTVTGDSGGVSSPMPLPKRYHPDFKTPTAKPVGKVVPDWSNPITKGLGGAFLCQPGNMLANSVPGMPHLTIAGSFPQIAPVSGDARIDDTQNYDIRCGAEVIGGGVDFDRDFTMFIIMDVQKAPVGTGDQSIFDAITTSTLTDATVYLNNTGTNGHIGVFNNNSTPRTLEVSTEPDFTKGVFESFTTSHIASSSTRSLYLNGGTAAGGDQATDNNATYNTNFTDGAFSLFNDLGGSTNNRMLGQVKVMYMFNRALSDDEVAQLHRDPYALLKPDLPAMYFTAASEVVGVTAPMLLPKRYHPDFADPAVKPVGIVELDFSNPLTRGLTGAFLFQPNNLHKNLVPNGYDIEVAASQGLTPDSGNAFADDTVNYSLRINKGVVTSGTTLNTPFTFFTIADLQKAAVGNDDQNFVSSADGISNQDVPFYIDNLGTLGRLTSFDTSTQQKVAITSTEPDFTKGVFESYASTHESAVRGMYINGGTLSGGDQSIASATAYATVLSNSSIHLFNDNTVVTKRILANVKIFLIYNRKLSSEEISVLHNSPYDIFKPLVPAMYFTAAEAGGSITGTGALVADDSIVAASGQREVTGTSSLVADDSVVSGSGQVEHAGTGSLVADDVTVASSGIVGRIGTGSLIASDVIIVGVGQVVHTGTSSLVSEDSTVTSSGIIGRVGTSVLVVDDSLIISSGIVGRVGSGSLAAADSEVDGVGSIGGVITGTGTLIADDSVVVSTGKITRIGTGSLIVSVVIVTASGQRVVTGSGTLVSGDSLVTSSGVIGRSGTGTLTAIDALVSGNGQREHTATSTLVANDSQVAGIGSIGGVITGTGSLIASDVAIVGIGITGRVGVGSLLANDSQVSSIGTRGITGSGTLVSDDSTIASTGSREVTGTSTLVAEDSTLLGNGIRVIIGSGTLVSSDSQVLGVQLPDVDTPSVRRASASARDKTSQVVASLSRRGSVSARNRTQQVIASPSRRAQPED